VGLRQGEVLSPILFSLFIEDLETNLQCTGNPGISLDQLSLFLLLFADDLVLLAETPDDLQESLDKLQEYCLKWGLSVNTSKTKTMVFCRGGPLRKDEV
jgi:hypothetical protein